MVGITSYYSQYPIVGKIDFNVAPIYNADMNVLNIPNLIAARGSMSRKAVADRLGLSRQQIWNYENGRSLPPIDVLMQLARLYNVDVLTFLTDRSVEVCIK